MGYVMGGTIFNMSMHVRVYRHILIKFPKLIQRALTDNLIQFGKPVEEKDSWDKTYTMVAEALHYYDHLANPIGIYRHPDKGKLMLPPAAPDPREGHPILLMTKVCRVVARVRGVTRGQTLMRSNWSCRKSMRQCGKFMRLSR